MGDATNFLQIKPTLLLNYAFHPFTYWIVFVKLQTNSNKHRILHINNTNEIEIQHTYSKLASKRSAANMQMFIMIECCDRRSRGYLTELLLKLATLIVSQCTHV